MQKADTYQYIALCKNTECNFSHGDALTEALKPQKVKEDDTVLGTYHHGSAFKSNFYYILKNNT